MNTLLIFSSSEYDKKIQVVVSEGLKFAGLSRDCFSLAVVLECYTENMSPNVMSDTLLAHNLFHIGDIFLCLLMTHFYLFRLCNN